jgi:hypothetical protein
VTSERRQSPSYSSSDSLMLIIRERGFRTFMMFTAERHASSGSDGFWAGFALFSPSNLESWEISEFTPEPCFRT